MKTTTRNLISALTIMTAIQGGVIIATAVAVYPILQTANALSIICPENVPIATSGDNVYITWWSNKTGNHEVLFRSSDNNGASFGDKINLSNTTTTESVDAMLEASGDNVFVTWWERNETANDPVMRISNDNGLTFGPILSLADNGTIGG
jgi:hypothetical protein